MNTPSSPTPESTPTAQPQLSSSGGQNPSAQSSPAEPAQANTPLQPWDLQPGETPAAFQLFQRFLQLGPEGTLHDLAKPDDSDYAAIKQQSSRHHWRERAAAFRQHEANLQLKPLEKAITENSALMAHRAQVFNQQQWEIGQLLTNFGYEAARKVTDGKFQTPRLDEIPRIFSAATKLARQSFELPAGPHAPSAELQAAIHESEIALQKIYGRMAAEGLVPNVHDQINAERTPAQPANPADPPKPPAPDTPKP